MSDQKRIDFLDSLKGLAIFLVVFAHVIAWSYTDFNSFKSDFRQSGLFWCIYAFHMPLFFLISGFLAYFSVGRYSKLELIKKRTVQLLIPYISATLFVEFILQQEMNYWFLIALFVMNLVLVLSYNKSKPHLPIATWILLYGLTVLLPALNNIPYLYIPAFKKYFPYFLLGYYCSMYPGLYAFLKNKIYRISLFVFAGLMIYQLHRFPLLPENLITNEKFIDVFNYLKAFFAIVFFFFLFEKNSSATNQGFASRYLKKMGKSSLAIYIIHVLFKFAIPKIGDIMATTGGGVALIQIIYATIFSIILVIISLIISRLMEEDRFQSFLFLGKK
ncbi:MAG: acyltransferase family protein [Candidatus Saccharibacteria bacterium]|nr:acyltransferase family protein [Candidatus Saccharibacteria bacterium]